MNGPGQGWKTRLRAEPQSANASVFIRKNLLPLCAREAHCFSCWCLKGTQLFLGNHLFEVMKQSQELMSVLGAGRNSFHTDTKNWGPAPGYSFTVIVPLLHTSTLGVGIIVSDKYVPIYFPHLGIPFWMSLNSITSAFHSCIYVCTCARVYGCIYVGHVRTHVWIYMWKPSLGMLSTSLIGLEPTN